MIDKREKTGLKQYAARFLIHGHKRSFILKLKGKPCSTSYTSAGEQNIPGIQLRYKNFITNGIIF